MSQGFNQQEERDRIVSGVYELKERSPNMSDGDVQALIHNRMEVMYLKRDYPMLDLYTLGSIFDECKRKNIRKFRSPPQHILKEAVEEYLSNLDED